jgi:ComF family protein
MAETHLVRTLPNGPNGAAWLARVLDVLFPPRCASCKRLGTLFCGACQAQLVRYPGTMRRLPPALDSVEIGYVFSGPLRAAVHQLKYAGAPRLAQPLGVLLAATVAAQFQARPVDALVPIPLHPQRLAERGYNQAAELATVIAQSLGVPVADDLVRMRATTQQASLNARERAANVTGAFQWVRGTAPMRVALIDDVLTTGATMNACAEALRTGGAQHVRGLALARSRPDLDS